MISYNNNREYHIHNKKCSLIITLKINKINEKSVFHMHHASILMNYLIAISSELHREMILRHKHKPIVACLNE